ncbi:hypothetical protein AYL99_10014 [Fonsecaea erecta]|uniref:Nucleoside phosphorylase domain-containing protein n=1 Tax=Fonsecaea erecta TaxID=1367422 RepID=A0A178Z827_9EURO|nr:hypothetical protein AYL99_10014 [Fonsecaea erecta]OAP55862.1 hypothetical protein AYL99_10014 [Fonsecaea erecta]
MAHRRLQREEYTVGWLCALPIERAAAEEMLDEKHEDIDQDARDNNLYSPGRIGEHNVVIVCLPNGLIGNNTAAAMAAQMMSTFRSMQFILMVGVGGGVPSLEADIRLGDVVVSNPNQGYGGVIQYDFGKATPSGFQRTGFLNSPPLLLLNAVAKARTNQLRGTSKLLEHISKLRHLPEFTRGAAGPDVLFEYTYNHEGGPTCQSCSAEKQVTRQPRSNEEPVVHYGTIASGNQVVKDAAQRDSISKEFGGVLCFEMEAAGLMNGFPCLVIRGICDYADSHKNKKWQAYAAGTAAAYAREVLSMIPPAEGAKARELVETIKAASGPLSRLVYTGHMARTDILVNHPLLKEDLPLASLVCNLQSPHQDAYKGADMDEEDWSVALFEDYSAYVGKGRQSLFKEAVSTIFSRISDAKIDERIHVSASKAQKYTLLQPQMQFRKLCKIESVREWIRDNYNYNKDLFFVVGYLTMTGATVVRGPSGGEIQSNLDATLPLPAGAATNMATARDLDAQTTAHMNQNSLESVFYKADGEQIFCICYRKLKFSWFSQESTLDGSNRWKLFTSNRGSSRAAKSFVEIDIDKRDFVPEIPHETVEGPQEKYIIPHQLPRT